jgi:hypothetical protein
MLCQAGKHDLEVAGVYRWIQRDLYGKYLSEYCRACKREKANKWNKDHRAARTAYQRKWRKKTKDHVYWLDQYFKRTYGSAAALAKTIYQTEKELRT